MFIAAPKASDMSDFVRLDNSEKVPHAEFRLDLFKFTTWAKIYVTSAEDGSRKQVEIHLEYHNPPYSLPPVLYPGDKCKCDLSHIETEQLRNSCQTYVSHYLSLKQMKRLIHNNKTSIPEWVLVELLPINLDWWQPILPAKPPRVVRNDQLPGWVIEDCCFR